jgi:hypothetical protein
MDRALVDAHLEGERRLRQILRDHIGQAWNGLPGHDRANLDQWLSETVPAVLAAEQQSSALTNAYIAAALERSEPFPVAPEQVTGSALRGGVDPSVVYERPFVTLWSLLSEGKPWGEASLAALQRAETLGATDVQLAMRDTLGAIQAAEPAIVGWERVSNPGACDFCQQVNGAFVYGGSEPLPLHANCGCSAVPVLRESGRRERTPLPEGLAVHEHGELGPVLTAAGDHFMGESEALAR